MHPESSGPPNGGNHLGDLLSNDGSLFREGTHEATRPLRPHIPPAFAQAVLLDAFSRAAGAASSDAFGAASPASFDVFVPTDALAQAQTLITDELAAIERDAEANARAAEEEALSGENPVDP